MSRNRDVEDLLVTIYREQRPRLWGFFLRGSDRSAAEDLLQEMFLRLWDHRDRIAQDIAASDREGMRRYLWRAARNLMIDEIRQRQRRRAGEAPLEGEARPAADPAAILPGPAASVEHADCLRVLRETVGRLTNRKARVCLELWLEGRDLLSIAEELGLGPGQVRGLLQRARAEVILRAGNVLRPVTAGGSEAPS